MTENIYKKAYLKLLIILITGIIFTACSNRLTGTWNVQKYETSSPGEQHVSLKDIGSMTFFNDGTGKKQIEYSVLGVTRKDTLPFQWKAAETNVTIDSQDSEFGKTWIIIEDQRKFQKWKSTDGTNQIQMLELIK